MCLLRGRTFGFDSRASGRADYSNTIAFDFIEDDARDFFRKFANGGPAVLLYHPVLLTLRGAAVPIHVSMAYKDLISIAKDNCIV